LGPAGDDGFVRSFENDFLAHLADAPKRAIGVDQVQPVEGGVHHLVGREHVHDREKAQHGYEDRQHDRGALLAGGPLPADVVADPHRSAELQFARRAAAIRTGSRQLDGRGPTAGTTAFAPLPPRALPANEPARQKSFQQ